MIRTLPALWQHQKAAIERARNRFALFFDPGCGKTRTAIELYKRANAYSAQELLLDPDDVITLKPFPQYRRMIIIAPLNVCRNWEKELAQFLDCSYSTFLVSGQTKDKKLKIIESFNCTHDNVRPILIINMESLRGDEYRKLLRKSNCQFFIVDESHNFKTPTSQQTIGLLELINGIKPKHLYLLTGTPAPKGWLDLWSTFVLMGKTTDSFFIWRKKNFIDKNERRRGMNNYWPDYVIDPGKERELKGALAEVSVTARKNEVLDLPPLLRTNLYSDMGKTQKRHYETMLEFLFAIDSEGFELNASNVLSRTLRLQQILAGFLGEQRILDSQRIDALNDAIDMAGNEQFLIWTIFKPTYREIAELLEKRGISFSMMTGLQTAEERFRSMEDFQSGKLKCLVGHPKAGGVGVNLTAASYSIFYTKSFSLVDYEQACARNNRGGSERHNRLTEIHIQTAETIDEEITAALIEGKSIQDFILGLKTKYSLTCDKDTHHVRH